MPAHRAMVRFFMAMLALCRFAAGADPECTFDSCPVCLEDAVPTGVDIHIDGKDGVTYTTPFRMARAANYWDSQSLKQHVLGILFREKLGINVIYTDIMDEFETMLALMNCAGYREHECLEQPETAGDAQRLVDAGNKVYPDPLPDIFASVDNWPRTLEELEVTNEQMTAGNILVYGSAGTLGKEWLYILPGMAKLAWDEKQATLTHYLTWTTDVAKDFITTPRVYMDANIKPEVSGCPGDPDIPTVAADGFQILTDLGWVCKESWWLTPACAALPNWKDDCAGVLDDSWDYVKDTIWNAMSHLGMRVAKLTAGFDGMYEIVMSNKFNTSFFWWDTDTQFASLHPSGVQLEKDLDTESVIIQKVAWSNAGKYSTKVDALLKGVTMSNSNLNPMLALVSEAKVAGHHPDITIEPGFFQKIACDWMRANAHIWQKWLPDPQSCNVGEIFNETVQSCDPCPAGTQYLNDKAGRRCVKCTVGRAQALSGKKGCDACKPGTFAGEPGMQECQACSVGVYSDSEGSSVCRSCSAGKKRPDLWTSLREAHLDDGSIGWFPTEGADNAGACGCQVDAWMGPGHAMDCRPCEYGMNCPGGFSFEVAKGFYAEEDKNTSLYLCLNVVHCPGGVPGVCPGQMLGLLCEQCPDGKTASKNSHVCDKCQSAGNGFFGLASAYIPLSGIAASLYNARNKEVKIQMSPSNGITSLIGVQIGMLQIVGIVSSSPVAWPPQFQVFLKIGKFFMFDIGILDLRCGLGKTDAAHYSILACLFVHMFLGIWLCHLVTLPFSKIRWNLRGTLNFSGQIFLLTFTSMVALAAFPMSCYKHPNKLSSMRAYPAVICGEHQHQVMLGVGLALFFLTITTTSALCYATWKAPSLSLRNLQALVFLVNNFRAEVWWWGIARLARSFLLAMVQVVFPSDGVAQVFAFGVLLSSSGLAQAVLWPWKIPVLNYADAITNALMLLVIFMSAITISKDAVAESGISGPLMSALMGSIFAVTGSTCCYLACVTVQGKKRKDRHKEVCSNFVHTWFVVSDNVLQQTEEAMVNVISEIAEYDFQTLKHALTVLESVGLNTDEMQGCSSSLRIAPPSSERISVQSGTRRNSFTEGNTSPTLVIISGSGARTGGDIYLI